MTITRKDFLLRSAAVFTPALSGAAHAATTSARAPEHPAASLGLFNVLDFGAKGDGRSKDTAAIQAAIDAAGRAGGTVVFPAGNYLSGTVRLRSSVACYLGPGSTLTASPDEADFEAYEKLPYDTFSDEETSYFRHALITAEGAENISVAGQGRIEGNRNQRGGPKLIALKTCRLISVHRITLANAPNYNISLLGCDYVDIDGVTIFNGYADGIDLDCCRFVRVANCYVETFDDAIVPKTSPALGSARPTENVTVTNCVLTTACYALKLGTESSGDFSNIAFSNSTVFSRRDKWNRGPLGGVAIESVDGGNIDRIVVTNITMHDVWAPIFIRLGGRGRAQKTPTPGTLRNVVISHISATGAALASSITGIPGGDVGPISIQDAHISVVGKGNAARLDREIPENVSAYPETDMFGELPCYALYCRHVDGLVLDRIDFALENGDERPALVADAVKRFDLLSFRAAPPAGSQPTVVFRDVQQSLVHGARALPGTHTFLQLSGAEVRGIRATANDFSEAQTAIDRGHDVSPDVLSEQWNLTSRK
ncbi:MAG TPA: glycosyl hydrolase family 28-related protein [Terriglobales bacterium]|nr:glycosyl hydrolase family 28-related protein [Terriglobales bacterium]